MNDSKSRALPLTLLSYGAGQDSWACLLMYAYDAEFRRRYAPGRFVVAMSDTGAEHPETYDFVEYTKTFCASHGIEFYHVTPEMGYHTGDWQGGLLGMYEAKSVIGSAAFPMSSCTASLKINPLYKWFNAWVAREYGLSTSGKDALKEYAKMAGQKINVLIGFAVGEESRAGISTDLQTAFEFACDERSSDPIWMQQSIRKRFPLIEMGYDRRRCQEYARNLDQPVPYPSACYACHWKSDFDVLWTQLKYPALYERWKAAEQKKLTAWADEDFRRARQRVFKPNSEFINSPVSGKFTDDGNPILLEDRAAAADRQLTAMGLQTADEKLAWLDHRRLNEGHGVKSKAA